MLLQITPLPGIPVIESSDDLARITQVGLVQAGIQLEQGDILVYAQKIVSKAEDRFINLQDVVPSKKATGLAIQAEKDPRLMELILRESTAILRIRPGTIIVEHRLGFICANAGIDHSNVRKTTDDGSDWVLLLPRDPDHSASLIRKRLETISQKHVGVMIIDSHGRAWRQGVVGVCIGLSGLPALVDKRGDPDLFGYRLRITTIAAADELAAAASLVMGQADEGTPIIHVRGFPYALREGSLKELIRPRDLDLFR